MRGDNLKQFYKNISAEELKVLNKRRTDSTTRFFKENPNKLAERNKAIKLNHVGSLGKRWKLSAESIENRKIKQKGSGNNAWKHGKSISKAMKRDASKTKTDSCEVCGAIGKTEYDHDHKTGMFRGWICHRCNWILGLAKDNSEMLMALSNYLLKAKEKQNQSQNP